MTTKSKFSWAERFALIDHYKPSDDQICTALHVSPGELETARQLRANQSIIPSKDIDVSAYSDLFADGSPTPSSVTSTKKPVKAVAKTSTKLSSDDDDDTEVEEGVEGEETEATASSPETATKKSVAAAPKKRGRKGTKITQAFMAIPYEPTPVQAFAEKFEVSVPVLRQSKRFDTSPEKGPVRVKLNKATNILEIWREAPTSAKEEKTE